VRMMMVVDCGGHFSLLPFYLFFTDEFPNYIFFRFFEHVDVQNFDVEDVKFLFCPFLWVDGPLLV
jgi:hypothetical protein